MHHEVVPHYMRTKLDLDLEAKQKELEDHVACKGAELSGEVKKFNEMLSSGIDRVTEMREELEEQKTRTGEKEQLSATCIISYCRNFDDYYSHLLFLNLMICPITIPCHTILCANFLLILLLQKPPMAIQQRRESLWPPTFTALVSLLSQTSGEL